MSSALLQSCAYHFDISLDMLCGKGRLPHLVRARAAVAYVLRHRDGSSYPRIGKRLCRDHSTVIHLVRNASAWRLEHPEVDEFIATHMGLPKHCPSVIGAPAFSAELIEPEPQAKPELEVVKLAPICDPTGDLDVPASELVVLPGITPFILNEDGFTAKELLLRSDIRSSSTALLAAIRREHPNRVGARAA